MVPQAMTAPQDQEERQETQGALDPKETPEHPPTFLP